MSLHQQNLTKAIHGKGATGEKENYFENKVFPKIMQILITS